MVVDLYAMFLSALQHVKHKLDIYVYIYMYWICSNAYRNSYSTTSPYILYTFSGLNKNAGAKHFEWHVLNTSLEDIPK